MPFRYLKDPLFVACFAAYWVNCWLEQTQRSLPWLESHLNDLICIPFWVPIMLRANRSLGLRLHDNRPSATEIAVPLIVWSILFECFIPQMNAFQGRAVADPIDVLCYAFGAFFAALIWSLTYGDSAAIQPTDVLK